MKTVYIIGAGQIGSRHLQALKAINCALDVTVVDPSEMSLKQAQERYAAIPGDAGLHNLHYVNEIPLTTQNVDVAIIATNSDTRRAVTESLFKSHSVRHLILEKLLFNNEQDYYTVERIIQDNRCNAWVNCAMRTMPFYRQLKDELAGKRLCCVVSGSNFGLITNAIHYLDYMVYLNSDVSFTIDTTGLDVVPIKSKRAGFLELTGTLGISFSKGCRGVLNSYPDGTLSTRVDIICDSLHCISFESQNMAQISRAGNDGKWTVLTDTFPFQSQLTTNVINKLLYHDTCDLVCYNDSMRIHLALLNPLRTFLNQSCNMTIDYYPFT